MPVVGINLGDDRLDRRLAGNGSTFTPIYTAVKNVCYTLSLRCSFEAGKEVLWAA